MFEGLGIVFGVLLGLIIIGIVAVLVIFLFKYAYILIFSNLIKSLCGIFSDRKKKSKKKKGQK